MLVALLTVTYHLLGFSLHQAVLGHLESWDHPKIISHHNHQDINLNLISDEAVSNLIHHIVISDLLVHTH